MPMSSGFNHVATVTADLDRVVTFYRSVFDAEVTLEIAARDDHPRMVILDLGSGGVLNVDWSWKHSRRSISDHSSQSYRKSRNTCARSGPVQHKPARLWTWLRT